MMRRILPDLALALLALAGMLAVNDASAEEKSAAVKSACEECWAGSKHVLDGHAFLPTYAVPSPFADSSAQLALSVGTGDLSNTALLGPDRLQLGSFSPQALGQISLFSPRFAFSFGLAGAIVTGTNTQSVARYGASASYSFKFGAIYELIRQEKQVFSIALDTTRPHRFAASPLEVARAGIQDVFGSGDPEYTSDTVYLTWKPTLRYARALSPVFGVKASLGFRFNTVKEGEDSDASRTKLNLGLSIEADLKPISGVPVAFAVNYLRGQLLSESGSNSDTITGSLYETATPVVNVGLEVGTIRTEFRNTTLFVLAVKSYFD